MPTTDENLQTAFAGESQANRKYLAFARKAKEDGFPQVAELFILASEAETIHALGHLKAMGQVNSTEDNLKAAVEGETYEFTQMYPPMLEQAEAEGHHGKRMFKFAMETEKVHAALYQQALDAVKAGKDLEKMDIYLCPVCGNLELGAAPDNCSICGAPGAKFTRGHGRQ
ncbi:Rubrerythrin-like protein DVU2318 [hydrothermal vent metagenome]|uniref:Rubrerythrin-like protein DVU2318 n=1 Tax=hydrothermal vent metagenome TaxID=652676 RepID=A0A3B1C1P8_9ZZZZ